MVKENCNINKVNTILSIFGLVLLLLLSPCKVRNFIQAELGVPQTKVSTKSQSTISQSNCKTFERSETIKTNSKISVQQALFLDFEAYRFDFITYLVKPSFNLNTSQSQQATDVPFYILYQNLKIYS